MKTILGYCTAVTSFALLVGCASSRGPQPQQPQPQPQQMQAAAQASVPLLSQNLLRSEATLKRAFSAKTNVENSLAEVYESVQLLCKAKFDELEQDQERYAAAEARTNVLGSLLALLGSVTAYAPGKTVLMGIGLSSSSSGGSVSSGITQFFSNKSAADKTTLSILRNQLALTFDRYDALDPISDPQGTRRATVLARAKGICLGLAPSTPDSATPPAAPASGTP